ncbi:MAG: ion transporter [Gammaproteobacteria bacterium]|nr:ion transporter [Gammaproteobacteria bacterium]
MRATVQDTDTRAGRMFDLTAMSLIGVSVITFSIETLPGLSSPVISALWTLEVVITLLFTIEYVLRISTALPGKKFHYIFSFYGIIDLLAILPFYLALGIDLRSLRVIRLLRIFRVLKMGKYNKSAHRLARAIMVTKCELVIFLSATFMLVYLASVGIYYFENTHQPDVYRSIFDGLWWAVITLTTVGYGDMYPVTAGGKLFTFVILMCGLGIVAIPTGLIASAFSNIIENEQRADS